MLRNLAAYNQERMEQGSPPVKIGVGLNSGSVMLGTVGGQFHMDGTVISDTVNLAARIEDLTKQYQVPLLISHYTLTRLDHPEDYAYRLIDQVFVKGRSEAVSIFEVFDADPPAIRSGKLQMKTRFEEALTLFNMGYCEGALQGFEACLKATPNDVVAVMYRDRCLQEMR